MFILCWALCAYLHFTNTSFLSLLLLLLFLISLSYDSYSNTNYQPLRELITTLHFFIISVTQNPWHPSLYYLVGSSHTHFTYHWDLVHHSRYVLHTHLLKLYTIPSIWWMTFHSSDGYTSFTNPLWFYFHFHFHFHYHYHYHFRFSFLVLQDIEAYNARQNAGSSPIFNV